MMLPLSIGLPVQRLRRGGGGRGQKRRAHCPAPAPRPRPLQMRHTSPVQEAGGQGPVGQVLAGGGLVGGEVEAGAAGHAPQLAPVGEGESKLKVGVSPS